MAPNLGWSDVDVSAQLRKRFGCSVAVLNDVDAGVYGILFWRCGRRSFVPWGCFLALALAAVRV